MSLESANALKSDGLARVLALIFLGMVPSFGDTLPAPVLLGPGNGVTAQFFTRMLGSPFARWTAIPGATAYHLKFGPDSTLDGPLTFSNPNVSASQEPGAGLSYQRLWEFSSIRKLFWKVAAIGPEGDGIWSETRSINIVERPPDLSIPDGIQGVPVLNVQSLVDNTENKPDIIDGEKSTWGYRLQASEDSTFGTTYLDTSFWGATPDRYLSPVPITVQFLLSLKPSTRYFFRAREQDSGFLIPGQITRFVIRRSPWSVPRAMVSTTAPIAPPTLLGPADGAVDVPLKDVTIPGSIFKWEADRGASSYSLRIAEDSAFQTGLIEKSGYFFKDWHLSGVPTLVARVELLPGRMYYWSVRSHCFDLKTDWSTTRSFRTVPVPGSPSPVYPLPSERVLPRDLPLSWSAVPGVEKYVLRVAPDSGRGPLKEITLDRTDWILKDPVPGTSYIWSVKALSNNVSSTGFENQIFHVVSIGLDSMIEATIPFRNGAEWTYSLYQENSGYNVSQAFKWDTRDSGLIDMRMIDVVDRSDTLFFTVQSKQTGKHFELGQTWQSYSREWLTQYAIANTRSFKFVDSTGRWEPIPDTWYDHEPVYFARRHLLEATLEAVVVNGQPSHRFVVPRPKGFLDVFTWDKQYLKGYGLLTLNRRESSGGGAGHWVRTSQANLTRFMGNPLPALDIRPDTNPVKSRDPGVDLPPSPARFRSLPAYLDAIPDLCEASVHDFRGRLLRQGRSGSDFHGFDARGGLLFLRIRTSDHAWTRILPP